ncbi:hypothetical protein REPUB_Repub07fG0053800 [Reevesia pubescens]
MKALPNLFLEHNRPSRLFPRNIICYEIDESKSKVIVYFSSPCEVSFKDALMVRYATRVKAKLSRGKLGRIVGMKTKVIYDLKSAV